jgi:hypothetical protein
VLRRRRRPTATATRSRRAGHAAPSGAFGTHARVVRRRRLVAATVGEKLVMLDPASGAYFGLDACAEAIWAALDRPRHLEEVCTVVGERFGTEASSWEAEVRAFVEELLDAGLVELVDQPAG